MLITEHDLKKKAFSWIVRGALTLFASTCYPQLAFFNRFFWLHQVLVVAHRVFDLHCLMWDLVPWPGIKPGPAALGMQSLSHGTTREVPWLLIFNVLPRPFNLIQVFIIASLSKTCLHITWSMEPVSSRSPHCCSRPLLGGCCLVEIFPSWFLLDQTEPLPICPLVSKAPPLPALKIVGSLPRRGVEREWASRRPPPG